MRGKRHSPDGGITTIWIIPAHAGQTTTWQFLPKHPSDHPRACGANGMRIVAGSRMHGSSPRMRGKPTVDNYRYICTMDNSTDHPRACGANRIASTKKHRSSGSSPRMRGKPRSSVTVRGSRRIIPAHAGQTTSTPTTSARGADHPRACGANVASNSSEDPVNGSSPRMRGKLENSWDALAGQRIIPAHAGQTVRFYAKTLERWTLNNWIRTVAPIFVLLFLPPVIGQNAYIERHYSNQSFSWFSKLHYASAFDLSLVA